MTSARRKLIGWYAYDWASQPYHTLIVTFIFGPYVVTLVGDPAKAQSAWAATLALSGLATGILAPILGAIADESGRLVRWTALLSLLYMACAAVLWFAAPGMSAVWVILFAFGIGLLAVELATTVTNAMLPRLAPRQDIGGVSGTGFALGYLGGLVALLAMLAFFAENDAGKTLLGQPPLLGLDPSQREGTRSVGPFTALWYGVFMIPFFLFLRDPMREGIPPPVRNRLMDAAQHVRRSLRRLPQRPSLASYLASSMLY
ncbi:MAG: MFS transporter, partial [Mangrovicoccus sp.]